MAFLKKLLRNHFKSLQYLMYLTLIWISTKHWWVLCQAMSYSSNQALSIWLHNFFEWKHRSNKVTKHLWKAQSKNHHSSEPWQQNQTLNHLLHPFLLSLTHNTPEEITGEHWNPAGTAQTSGVQMCTEVQVQHHRAASHSRVKPAGEMAGQRRIR